MNIKEYIESGMLELYAAGSLSASENAEVEALLKQYPELKAELEEIEISLEQYARASAREARPEIRQAILNRIEDDPVPHKPFAERKAIKIRQIIFEKFNYFAAASIALIVISASTAVYYYGKWVQTEKQLATLQAENLQYAELNKTYKASMESYLADLVVMRGSGNMVVQMKGDSISGMMATVYWNKAKKEVFLDVNKLPPLPPEKQYQLWAITDGKPVGIGVFDMPASGEPKLLKMKETDSAQVFAVTLEPKGGSEAPTSNPMIMGKAI